VGWRSEVRRALEEAGLAVEVFNYGYFEIIRSLLDAKSAANDIAKEIRLARDRDDPHCSLIADGFGTFLVAQILKDHSDLKFNRIIFSSSIVSRDFDFERFQARAQFRDPLVNEVSTRNTWPALIASTLGYGASGTIGFGGPCVVDRWHNGMTHSQFVDQEFCRKYWVPFLSDGRIVPGDLGRGPIPFWLQLVLRFPIRYVALIAVGALVARMAFVAFSRW
jgi:hypothetical protein